MPRAGLRGSETCGSTSAMFMSVQTVFSHHGTSVAVLAIWRGAPATFSDVLGLHLQTEPGNQALVSESSIQKSSPHKSRCADGGGVRRTVARRHSHHRCSRPDFTDRRILRAARDGWSLTSTSGPWNRCTLDRAPGGSGKPAISRRRTVALALIHCGALPGSAPPDRHIEPVPTARA